MSRAEAVVFQSIATALERLEKDIRNNSEAVRVSFSGWPGAEPFLEAYNAGVDMTLDLVRQYSAISLHNGLNAALES
jgi:hypothetical protein